MTPRAAIIIPHYNDPVRLRRCLAALQPVPQDVELCVVDNGSDADMTGLAGDFPDLRLLVEPAPGAAMARNRGVAETRAPLLFFLDSDCVPAPDWLRAAFDVAGRADIVGGRVEVFDEGAGPRSGAQAFEAVFAFDNEAYIRDKGFSVTANLLTRRDVFEDVGPFRTGLSEDLDWCRRARARGHSIAYAESLAVAHPARGDWAALRRKWLRLTREGFGVNGQGRGARLRWAARALLMVPSAVVHAPRVLRSDRLTGWRERRAALGTLVRLRARRAVWMLRQALGLPI